jgi:hypothetical protein
MEFWIIFWIMLFFASLVLFAVMAVAVSIGGFFNIRSLFKTLSAESDRKDVSGKQG